MIEIKKELSNSYSFELKAESGQTLLKSIAFPNRETAKKTVRNLNGVGSNKTVFERKTNHKGDFLFSLKNKKGKIIGSSLLYNSEAGMENGIKNLVKRIDFLSEQNQL